MPQRLPSPSHGADHPFALPARLPPQLARVHAYWAGLLRGEAETPFADDFKPTDLPDLADRLLLIDVFDRPLRFRLQSIGAALGADSATGRFLDEIRPTPPLDFIAAQCSATVEAVAPTFFAGASGQPHKRLILPFWGQGQVSLLLGAIAFGWSVQPKVQ